VLACAALLLGASTTPAYAKGYVQGRGPGSEYNIGAGTSQTINWWVGAYRTTAGLGFCMEPTRPWDGSVAMNDPKELTSFTNEQGVKLTTAQLNQLAYVMWKSVSAGVSTNKVAVTYKLVVMTLLGYNHVRVYVINNQLSKAYFNFSLDDAKSDAVKIAQHYGVLTAARNLLAEARAKANNWDGTGTLSLAVSDAKPGGQMTATVKLPGIGSGHAVAFTLTMPDGTKQSFSVDTENSVATFQYTIDAFGEFKISAKLAQAAAPRYPMTMISTGNTQDLLMVAGKARTWSGSTTTMVDMPNPKITTDISSQLILPGETIKDTVHLTDLMLDDDLSYVISGGLYGLAPVDGLHCPGSDSPDWATAEQLLSIEDYVVPQEEASATGEARIELGEWKVPASQPPICASYGETLTVLFKDQVLKTVEHPAGAESQTGLVLPVPDITTSISASTALPGDTLTDTVKLTGLDITGRILYAFDGKLIGLPMPKSGKCPGEGAKEWADGETLTTFSEKVTSDLIDDNGEAVIGGLGEWQVPDDTTRRCVTYQESLTFIVYGRDPMTIEHRAGNRTQTALTDLPVVPEPPKTPTPPPPVKKPPSLTVQTGGHVAGPNPWTWAAAGVLVLSAMIGIRLFSAPRWKRQPATLSAEG